MADEAAQDIQALNLRDRSEDTGREEVYEALHTEGNPNESGHTITTGTTNGSNAQKISYETVRVVGNGSFGVVFQATCIETGDTVAIKKVLQGKDIVHCHVTT
mmetsp:Transcript_27519/g.43981  ORF Transcript_27519/g.43981 Transcript_27519/m.43981 type:complete len:103 (+) Transcript_27519:276-584(+)